MPMGRSLLIPRAHRFVCSVNPIQLVRRRRSSDGSLPSTTCTAPPDTTRPARTSWSKTPFGHRRTYAENRERPTNRRAPLLVDDIKLTVATTRRTAGLAAADDRAPRLGRHPHRLGRCVPPVRARSIDRSGDCDTRTVVDNPTPGEAFWCVWQDSGPRCGSVSSAHDERDRCSFRHGVYVAFAASAGVLTGVHYLPCPPGRSHGTRTSASLHQAYRR